MKDDEGVVNRAIGRSSKNFRLKSAQRGARGLLRKATTEYTVLDRGEDITFVEFRPKTGRTHQIRVHAKAINHPIVCDNLYAPRQECKLGFNRVALHALSLDISTTEGEMLSIKAPLPKDFEDALKVFAE